MRKLFFVFLAFSLLWSCKSQTNRVEDDLVKCVNSSVSKYSSGNLDFYSLMMEVENRMIEEDLLESKDQENYLHLFSLLYAKEKDDLKDKKLKKFYEETLSYFKKEEFPYNKFVVVDGIFNQCPYKVSFEDKDGMGASVYNQGSIFNKLMEAGFNDEKLVDKLIKDLNQPNFNKIVYRAPVVLLFFIHLDQMYNPDQKKIREYEKGRKFINKVN